MGIAAYLWKKMIKPPANEPCLKISTEFTWKEDSLKLFCLKKHWVWNVRQNTQSSVGNTTLRGQALVCPPGILPLQEYCQGKWAETNLASICIKVGKEPKMCLIHGRSVDQGFMLWVEQDLGSLGFIGDTTSTVWPPNILTVLMYFLSPKSLTLSLKVIR